MTMRLDKRLYWRRQRRGSTCSGDLVRKAPPDEFSLLGQPKAADRALRIGCSPRCNQASLSIR